MPEYLDNPRRVPRDPVRCRAQLLLPSGQVETTTEDIGARGCQVVLPAALERGTAVALTLSTPRLGTPLRIEGRVAWVSPQAPWRAGIAYTARGLPQAAQWMETFRQASPELFGGGRKAQDRVPVEAMVFLGAAPRLADFTDDELEVLKAVGTGIRVAELRTALSGAWPRMQRGFFALLSQGSITLSRAAAVHPVTWKAILGAPQLPPPLHAAAAAPTPPPFPAVRAPTPAPAAPRATAPATAVPPPLAAAPASASAPTRPGVDGTRRNGAPAQDFVGAGVGWRGGPARPRSSEADALFQLAVFELREKRSHQALKLLRRALTLAPGDVEIAEAIGRAMSMPA